MFHYCPITPGAPLWCFDFVEHAVRISLRRILLGSPLPSEAYVHQRLKKRKALAVFSSDALLVPLLVVLTVTMCVCTWIMATVRALSIWRTRPYSPLPERQSDAVI